MQNAKLIFDPNLFQISLGKHHDKKVIWVKFNYDINLIHLLRSQAKAYWSASQNAWYLIDNYHQLNLCGIELDIVGKEVLSKISETNMPELLECQNILTLKSYSQNTIRTYSIEFAQLLYLLKDFPVQDLLRSDYKAIFCIVTMN